MTSLPTPDSPSSRTGIVDFAARSPSRMTRSMSSLLLRRSLKVNVPEACRLSRRTSSSSASTRRAFLIETCSRSAPTGLTTKSVAPGAHGRDHRLDRAVRRLHDGRNGALLLAHPLQYRHAVEIGHHEIENDEIDLRRTRFEPLQRGRAAVDRFALIAKAANERFQNAALHWIVIDNQHE